MIKHLLVQKNQKVFLHRITKDYGNAVGKNFLNSILIMVKQFITHYGFSIVMAMVILKYLKKNVQQILDDIQETYDIVSDLD